MGNCQDGNAVAATAPHAAKVAHMSAPTSKATPLENGAKYDTVVIGGGIAGVAAAADLANAGQRVAILEANNYLGGRLKTTPVNLQGGGTLQFDEGASWIHGSCEENPITELSKNVEGLVMKETEDDSVEVYDEKGQDVSKQVEQAFQNYQKIMEKMQSWQGPESMKTAFQKQDEEVGRDKFFMYNVANDVEFQTSGSIAKLAANGVDDDEFEGTEMLILSGYQKFVDTLAMSASFDVFLNQKVRKVAWSEEESQITVGNGVQVYAKNVVFAVPIGVLKAKSIEFSPNLPGWKTEAINSIGFGNVCKIVLDFQNGDVLPSENQYIGVVSDDVQKRGLGTYFLNLKNIAGIPALMTFGLGDNADEAENMSEGALKQLLAKRVSAFTSEEVKPQDFKLYKTSWRGNPNFKGTYAYASTETKPDHWENIAKPIFDSAWYFCGQHTTSKYRGTVHGAYLSGVATAKWIVNQTDDENWVYPDFQK